MKEKTVDKLFDSLYKLTDMRQIFRETSPTHDFNEEQKKKIEKIVEEVKQNLNQIKEETKND